MMDTKEARQRIENLTANFDQFMATLDAILRRAADALEPTSTLRQRQEARDAIKSYLARNDGRGTPQ